MRSRVVAAFAAVVCAVSVVSVGSAPAAAAVSSGAVSVSAATSPREARPVVNKAGVRGIKRAVSLARSGLRLALSTQILVERLNVGLADGSLSARAAARLEARINEGFERARAMFFKAEDLSRAAYAAHKQEASRILDSGAQPVSSGAWVAAVEAFESSMATFLVALGDDPEDFTPSPR